MSLPDYEDEETAEYLPVEGHFTDVFTAESTPPKWIIKDLLPVGVTFIGGPPKLARKSTVVLAIAALTAGYENKLLPVHMRVVERHGIVFVFSAEADAGTVRHMLEKDMITNGTPDGALLVADDPWGFRLDHEDGQRQLRFWLDQKQPKLVVFDPLRNFHMIDENDSGAMYNIVEPLRKWAVCNDAAVVFVHHTKKLSENDKRDYNEMDLRGTSALFGLADGVLISSPVDPASNVVRLKATFKRGQPWERTLRLAAYQHRDRPASEALDDATELVFKAVRTGCVSTEEVSAQTRYPPSRVNECLQVLLRNGLIERRKKFFRVTRRE